MKIVIASDFSAYDLKEIVKQHLLDKGHEVIDVGHLNDGNKVVYPDTARRLVKEIQDGTCERGIIFCGTGAGVSIACNKFKGIYCVPCESIYTATKSPIINNANVLAMGANVVGKENACFIADTWLEKSFCEGFDHDRTEFITGLLNMVKDIEQENFK